MKKLFLMVAIGILGLGIMFAPAAFSAPKSEKIAKGQNGQAGKSDVIRLFLYETDPETSEVVEWGAWGKIMYKTSGLDKLVFNAHGLEPGVEYSLLYSPEECAGEGMECIGSDTADEYGNVHIKVTDEEGVLIQAIVEQYLETGASSFMLALSEDVYCGDGDDPSYMTAWDPGQYLFTENNNCLDNAGDDDQIPR